LARFALEPAPCAFVLEAEFVDVLIDLGPFRDAEILLDFGSGVAGASGTEVVGCGCATDGGCGAPLPGNEDGIGWVGTLLILAVTAARKTESRVGAGCDLSYWGDDFAGPSWAGVVSDVSTGTWITGRAIGCENWIGGVSSEGAWLAGA
jgi:hypothetical protein